MKRFFLIILFVILGSNCFAALKWLESIEVENIPEYIVGIKKASV